MNLSDPKPGLSSMSSTLLSWKSRSCGLISTTSNPRFSFSLLSTLDFWRSSWHSEKQKQGWIFAKKAVEIAESLSESLNPSIMIKRFRAHLFKSKLLLEMDQHTEALIDYEKGIEIGLVIISVITNPSIEAKHEAKVKHSSLESDFLPLSFILLPNIIPHSSSLLLCF